MPASSRLAARCRGGSRVSMGGGDAGFEGAPVTFTERTLPDTQPPELHASAAQTSVPTTGPAAGFSPGRSSWRPCPKERFSPAHPGSSERRTGTRRMRGNTGGFGGPRLEPAHCHFVYVPSAEAGPRAKTRAFEWGSLRAPGPGAPRQVSTVTSSQQGAPPGRSSGAPGTEPRGSALRSARAHCASGRLREDFLGHAAGRPWEALAVSPATGKPVPRPARPAERRAPPCPVPTPIAVSSAPRAVVGALAGPRCGVLTQLLRRLLGLLCSRAGPAPRVTVAVSQVCVPCQGQPATGG